LDPDFHSIHFLKIHSFFGDFHISGSTGNGISQESLGSAAVTNSTTLNGCDTAKISFSLVLLL
jgi:hypothetical protein